MLLARDAKALQAEEQARERTLSEGTAAVTRPATHHSYFANKSFPTHIPPLCLNWTAHRRPPVPTRASLGLATPLVEPGDPFAPPPASPSSPTSGRTPTAAPPAAQSTAAVPPPLPRAAGNAGRSPQSRRSGSFSPLLQAATTTAKVPRPGATAVRRRVAIEQMGNDGLDGRGAVSVSGIAELV